MPLTVTPNEETVITALRAFLADVVPADFEIVQAQGNKVPEPRSPNFILTTMLRRSRLATNVSVDGGLVDDFPTESLVFQPTQFDYQIDVHGDLGGDAAQIITTTMRDPYATTFFELNSPEVSPLYANDPRQMPFTNGEQQYENRWVVEISLQVDPSISYPQQYANTLTIVPVSVEADFPPQ